LCFEPLFGGGLGETHAVHLRLIGKPIVGFMLVIIEVISLGAMVQAYTSEYRLEVAVFEGVGNTRRKFQVEGDVPHQH